MRIRVRNITVKAQGIDRARAEVKLGEIDEFCQKVLSKHWPEVPIHGDIRTLKGDEYGTIDLVCGGFPCQPFSQAGRQHGRNDNRDLWPEMFRVIREARPSWVIGENVAGFVNMELERSASDLEAEGYEVQPLIIPACAVGAPHKRDRIWIIAHSGSVARRDRQAGRKAGQKTTRRGRSMANSDSERKQQSQGLKREIGRRAGDGGENVADTDGNHKFRRSVHVQMGWQWLTREIEIYGYSGGAQWSVEPGMGRVVNGLPGRMDRLKALGNAVVPRIPELLGRLIIEIENNKQENL